MTIWLRAWGEPAGGALGAPGVTGVVDAIASCQGNRDSGGLSLGVVVVVGCGGDNPDID